VGAAVGQLESVFHSVRFVRGTRAPRTPQQQREWAENEGPDGADPEPGSPLARAVRLRLEYPGRLRGEQGEIALCGLVTGQREYRRRADGLDRVLLHRRVVRRRGEVAEHLGVRLRLSQQQLQGLALVEVGLRLQHARTVVD